MIEKMDIARIKVNRNLLPSTLEVSQEQSGKNIAPYPRNSYMAQKFKGARGELFDSDTPNLIDVLVVETKQGEQEV